MNCQCYPFVYLYTVHCNSCSVFLYIKLGRNDKSYLTMVSTVVMTFAGLGGSVGCAVRLETRRSRVQPPPRGWSGGAKVLCILHHWGVQLILAYSWARPAILVVGKGRGGMFLFLLFLHFHSCSSFFPVPLFHLLYSLFYLFSPFLWETTQNDPQGLTCR